MALLSFNRPESPPQPRPYDAEDAMTLVHAVDLAAATLPSPQNEQYLGLLPVVREVYEAAATVDMASAFANEINEKGADRTIAIGELAYDNDLVLAYIKPESPVERTMAPEALAAAERRRKWDQRVRAAQHLPEEVQSALQRRMLSDRVVRAAVREALAIYAETGREKSKATGKPDFSSGEVGLVLEHHPELKYTAPPVREQLREEIRPVLRPVRKVTSKVLQLLVS